MVDISSILLKMSILNASDLFISASKVPRFRINGKVVFDKSFSEIISDCDISIFHEKYFSEKNIKDFKNNKELDVALSLDTNQRFRINCYYQKNEVAMVVRKIPAGNLVFDEINLPAIFKDFASFPRGLILITGTASSGKSTSLSAIINYINTNFTKHIISIEDPIEYIHTDNKSLISQREVGNDTSSFSEALKRILRESPDVIVIGEMRDLNTVKTAISAALTGHLVISTLHTADVVQTIERIVNFHPEDMRRHVASDLSIALKAIVSQRLLARSDENSLIPALEILNVTPLAQRIIARQKFADLENVMKDGGSDGMVTFNTSLTSLFKKKIISKETGIIASSNKDEFILSIRGMKTGIDTLREVESSSNISKINMKSYLKALVKNNASDLLISAGTPASLRVNGEITELDSGKLSADDTRRLLFSILTPAQRAKFEDEKEIDFALSISLNLKRDKREETFRFRVNGYYQKSHISSAIRFIHTEIPSHKSLGLPDILLDMAKRNHGLILVTGPTGSGKTTTLACIVDIINKLRSCHIITIEDPIEYIHFPQKAIIEQREVYADTKSFTNALKYVLRQDPDVILIGEMRDPETISAALTAAETGHLVLATLHTNDAVQTVDRIVDSFPAQEQNQIRSQLAASILLVASQRLLPTVDESKRVASFEIMLGNIAIRSLIRDNKMHQALAIMETCAKEGMITMNRNLENLYAKGLISNETKKTFMT